MQRRPAGPGKTEPRKREYPNPPSPINGHFTALLHRRLLRTVVYHIDSVYHLEFTWIRDLNSRYDASFWSAFERMTRLKHDTAGNGRGLSPAALT